MTKKEAIDKIEKLAIEFESEYDTMPASAILNSLAGSMYANYDTELLKVVVEFTKHQLIKLRDK